jgi:hypothetical protein
MTVVAWDVKAQLDVIQRMNLFRCFILRFVLIAVKLPHPKKQAEIYKVPPICQNGHKLNTAAVYRPRRRAKGAFHLGVAAPI